MIIDSFGNVDIGTTAFRKIHIYRNDAVVDRSLIIDKMEQVMLTYVYFDRVINWHTGIDNSDGDKFKVEQMFWELRAQTGNNRYGRQRRHRDDESCIQIRVVRRNFAFC